MIKNVIIRIVCLMLGIGALTSCGQNADYASAIPEQVQFLAVFDTEDLIKKSGIADKEFEGLRTEFKRTFASEFSGKNRKAIEEIIDNPKQTGLDLEDPIYVFSSDSVDLALLIRIKNLDKTKAFVEKILDGFTLKDHNGILVAQHGADYIALGKETLALFDLNYSVEDEQAVNTIVRMMQTPREKSFIAQNAFAQLMKREGDIKMLTASGRLLKSDVFTMMYLGPFFGDLDIEKLYSLLDITFDDGKIDYSFNYYSEDDRFNKLMSQAKSLYTKPSGAHLPYIASDAILTTTMGVNGEKIQEYLNKNAPNLHHKLDSIGKSEGVNSLALLKSIEGDVTMSAVTPWVDASQDKSMDYRLYVDLKSTEELGKLLEIIVSEQQKKYDEYMSKRDSMLKADPSMVAYENLFRPSKSERLADGTYQGDMLGTTIYFGIKDKTFFLSTIPSSEIWRKADKSIKSGSMSNEFTDHESYMLLQIEPLLRASYMEPLFKFLHGSKEALAKINYINGYNEDEGASATIALTDQKTNALKQILLIVRSLSEQNK